MQAQELSASSDLKEGHVKQSVESGPLQVAHFGWQASKVKCIYIKIYYLYKDISLENNIRPGINQNSLLCHLISNIYEKYN